MNDAEQRLRRLEDRAELEDLVARYFLAADGDDADGLADCFTIDGSFSVSGTPCGDSRAAVVAFLVGERVKMGLTVHTPNLTLFTLDGAAQAGGIVNAHLELVLGGQSLFGAVRYLDRYVRTDGRWRIRSRDMRTVHIAPWAEVGEAFKSDAPVRWPGIPPLPTDFPRKRG
ncbi:MAG TPA: nuclear transport factor 2 family protein [Methylibium sp.]|nr:nuclear transport factor 2 family protein [Methylibium sp.]